MRKFLLLVAFSLLVLPASAVTIHGKVTDKNGKPLSYVNVALLARDSSVLGGEVTGVDGAYVLPDASEAAILQVSYMGYKTLTKSIQTGTYNYNFVLEEDAQQLAAVMVVGNKAFVEHRGDKVLINTAALPISIGSSCQDMLKRSPGISVDKDGNIKYNGKSVSIYLDDQPTHLSGEQLKAMLESMDGSDLQFEFISHPSAKYDAAGQGGIINIHTKHNRSRGFNGTVTAAYGGMYWHNLDEYMQHDRVSLNLNYRGEKGYTSVMAGQNYASDASTNESVTTTPESELRQQGRSSSQFQRYFIRFMHDFYLDSLNTLGFQLAASPSYNGSSSRPEDNYGYLYNGSVFSQVNVEGSNTDGHWLGHSGNLYFTHVFSKEKDAELRVKLDYDRNNTRMDNTINSFYVAEYPYTVDYLQNSRFTNDNYTGRLEYQTNFWKTGQVECGAKWSTGRTSYDGTVNNAATDFVYTEHIAALYLSMMKQFGRHWSVKLGLRGEYTHSRGQWTSADSSTVLSYFNLFPTAFVGYNPTENWSFGLSYTRRIGRPTYWDLNPTPFIYSTHTTYLGNGELKPAFSHDLKLSIGFSQFISLDLGYSYERDQIDSKTIILDNGDQISQTLNYSKSHTASASLGLSELPLVKDWLSWTINFDGLYSYYHSYDGLLNRNTWSCNVYSSLTLHTPNRWNASVEGYYSSPATWGSYHSFGYYGMDLSVKKDFRNGLTIGLRVNDLLLSSKFKGETLGLTEGYSTKTSFNGYGHSIGLSLTYRFGKELEFRQYRGNDSESDRMSKGSRGH